MKLLDRYVLHIFLAALVVFLVAFLALFLVIDFSSKLARFLSLRSVSFLPFVAEYYLCRIPLFLMYILPPLTLFAAMFTMIKLQRTNEVLPIVAAGVSLRRLTVPFVVASLLAGVAIAALDEFALPPLTQLIGRTDEILLTEEVSYGRVAYDGRNHFWASAYDHVKMEMQGVLLSRFTPALKHELIVQARTCRWDAAHNRWLLLDGAMLPYDAEGKPIIDEKPGQRPQRRVLPLPTEGFPIDSDVIPEDLKRKFTISGQYYALRELNTRIAKHPENATLLLLRHSKFSTPLSSLIILLLGLPFVVSASARSFFRGLTLCLIVTAAYYALHLGALELAKTRRFEPRIAAWIGPAAFGLLGLVMFLRMRS